MNKILKEMLKLGNKVQLRKNVIVISIIILLIFVLFPHLILSYNLPVIRGDYFPWGSEFGNHVQHTWVSHEHAGRPNDYLFHYPFVFVFSILTQLSNISVSSKVYILLPLFLAGFFICRVISDKNKSIWLAIFVAFVYMINPWTLAHLLAGHIGHLLGYSFLPLLANYLFKSKSFDAKIKMIIVLSLIGFTSYSIFVESLILIVTTPVLLFLLNRNLSSFLGRTKSLIIVVVLSILISSFWFLPSLDMFSSLSHLPLSERMRALSTNASPVNTLRFMGYRWNPFSHMFRLSGALQTLWYFMSFLIPSLTFLGIIYGFYRKKSFPNLQNRIRFFALLYLIFFPLASGTKIIDGLYTSIFSSVPFGGIFVDPTLFTSLLILSSCLIIGYTLDDLVKSFMTAVSKNFRRLLTFGVIVCLLFSYSFFTWPAFTGDAESGISNVSIPQDYQDTIKLLDKYSGYRTLYLPLSLRIATSWHPKVVEPTRFITKHPILNSLFSIKHETSPHTSDLLRHLEISIRKGYNFPSLLRLSNTKFVVIRKDARSKLINSYLMNFKKLENSKEIKKLRDTENICIYRISNPLKKIRFVKEKMLVFGGIRGLESLPLAGLSLGSYTYYFPEQEQFHSQRKKLSSAKNIFIPLRDFKSYLLYFVPDNYYLQGFEGTKKEDLKYQFNQLVYNEVLKSNQVNLSLTTKKKDNYLIFLRAFGSAREISVKVDGKEIKKITKLDFPGYSWIKYGFSINKGTHSVSLAYTGKFRNAFDEIVALPKEVWKSKLEKALSHLAKSKFTFFMYPGDFGLPSIPQRPKQKGQLRADLRVYIPSNDNYYLGFNGVPVRENPSFSIQMISKTNEITTEISFEKSDLRIHKQSVYLRKGWYKVRIINSGFKNKGVFLTNYTDNVDSESISFHRVSPTECDLSDIPKEGYIVFSESYHPNWALKNGTSSISPTLADYFAMSFNVSEKNFKESDGKLIFTSERLYRIGIFIGVIVTVVLSFTVIIRKYKESHFSLPK